MCSWKEQKRKAVTFSYDDGVTQDIRLIEMLNRYNLKCTFNLNSERLGKNGWLIRENQRIAHYKIWPQDVRKIYAGHEVAVHTLTHPNLTTLDEQEIIRQVEEDRLKLSDLAGYEVVGMAYPCGGVNNDDRVAKSSGSIPVSGIVGPLPVPTVLNCRKICTGLIPVSIIWNGIR